MLKTEFIFIYTVLIFLSSLTIINCSDDIVSRVPVDSSDFRYPFKDGSTWTYKKTFSVSDIRPDSILHYFTDYPLVTTGTVIILYDTVINSITTKCFLDHFTLQGVARTNRFYYINNDTSLILFASRYSPASGLFPLNTIRNNIFQIESSNPKTEDVISSYSIDTLFSTLKYPIITGQEWSYFNGFNTISRKYMGFENISVPAGTISCMKERTTYSSIPDDEIYNYYSKFGLMKRTQFINDISFSTIVNPAGIGIIDVNDDSEILSYNIPTD